MGARSRDQKQGRGIRETYDLLVVVGADVLRMSVMSDIDPMPADLTIVQLGLDDWEMGKNYPAAMAVRADIKEQLAALTPILGAKGGVALRRAAKRSEEHTSQLQSLSSSSYAVL